MSCSARAPSRLATLLSLLLVAGALTVAPAAQAQEREAAARARFVEGTKLYRAGRYAAAREAFRAAYRELPSPKILFNIAAAEAALGMNALALRHYRDARNDPSPKLTAPERAEAGRMIEKLRPRVASLVIEVEQPGFEVRVGDERLGTTPVHEVLWVEPGVLIVALTRAGRDLVLQRVAARAGEETLVRLQPPAALSPPPVGPAVTPPAPPASTASVPPGAAPPSAPRGRGDVDDRPGGRSLRPWGWGVLSGGAVATVIGGILYGVAGRDHDAMLAATDRTAFDAARSRGQARERGGIALFVVGGAALGTGAVLLVLGYRGQERPRAVSLAPVLAPGVAGLALGGRY